MNVDQVIYMYKNPLTKKHYNKSLTNPLIILSEYVYALDQ